MSTFKVAYTFDLYLENTTLILLLLLDLSSTPRQPMAIFGGHRLWHGYSIENSQTNNWDEYVTRPIGGYLNDLWIYTK